MRNKTYRKLVFLLVVLSTVSAELLKPPQPPQHNYAFNKFRPPPPPEPTFIQRVTSWFFPWGGVSSEEEFRMPASPKIDNGQILNQVQPIQYSPVARLSPPHVRDTEPTTARTTQSPPSSKCSPCNKVPWIPMVPTYQLPLVNSRPNQHQVYFKHHFGDENQYAQVPNGYNYKAPTSTLPPPTAPIKLQEAATNNRGHKYYGVPPIKNVQFQGYSYSTQSYAYPRATTYKPNTNTIDTSVITFTTSRTQNKRPSRFTAAGSVTNSEYLPPPNILPLEGENSQMAPIPIPNLSPTPIPPLFDSQNFLHDPYKSQKVGFIKLVPLEPVAQLSNKVNVQVRPDNELREFAAIKKSPSVEVINSNLVAEFTIPGTVYNVDPPKSYNVDSRPTAPLKALSLDIQNNLDGNTTINSPIVVDSFETATDNVVEGSEVNYQHEVDQILDTTSKSLKETLDTDESNRVFAPFNSIVTSTSTEGKYTVKFEPSIQTAQDLAEKKPKRNNTENLWKSRDRLTPLEFLDSPISHLSSTKPVFTTESPPPFKPIADFTKKLAILWTTSSTSSTTQSIPTSTIKVAETSESSFETETTTSVPITRTTISYLSTLSGITPPKEPTTVKVQLPTKKPKQIQIVIPYTTYHKPSPFKIKEEQEILTYRPLIRGHYVTHPTRTAQKNETKSSKSEDHHGHGYHNDDPQEYPDHAQESKIVESKVTVEPPKTTKYLTKILANNIRDLLKKEKSPRPPKVDLIRLQKNIDGWTEQSFLGKASTISLTGHTKSIPVSFLSTTMKATTTMNLPTTTVSPKQTFEPDLMEETKRQYDSILFKKDDLLYVKRHDRFLNRDNELVLINNNLTYNLHQDGVKVFAPKTTLTPKELWKRLHLSISPITNEKVYVVTPQPLEKPEKEIRTFRPRFSVRPTVAALKQPKSLEQKIERRHDNIETEPERIETIYDKSKDVKIITPQQVGVTTSMEVTSKKPQL